MVEEREDGGNYFSAGDPGGVLPARPHLWTKGQPLLKGPAALTEMSERGTWQDDERNAPGSRRGPLGVLSHSIVEYR